MAVEIYKNFPLRSLNTFRINSYAKYYVELENEKDIEELLENDVFKTERKVILGGGSNTIFSKPTIDALVIKPLIEGINILSEDDESVTIKVGAGENWHNLVLWAVNQNYSGIENLAYIPGTVGAAVVQNLAAYGQTLEDVLVEAETIDLDSGELKVFSKEETKPAYRTSIFKDKYKNRFLITFVTIKLSKIPNYDTHYHGRFSYESLERWLKEIKEPPYTPKDVAMAVTMQRKFKLPSTDELPSCGSFFVNPFVTVEKFHELEKRVDKLQHYPITKMEYDRLDWHDTGQDEIVKIPAGRLLEVLGWRGKWIGNVGTFDRHALIVVSNGKATGEEILDFANKMKQSVLDTFDIELKTEVNIV